MISSFKNKQTALIFTGKMARKLPSDIQRAALRKLKMIDSTLDLNDLKTPPANRLEALKGNRKGQHSIRINNQWRICFSWKSGNAHNVEIVDYH